MNVIVTGITGFAGSHLADLLVEKGHKVIGTRRWRSPMENIQHLEGKITLRECDMRDAVSVRSMVAKEKPDIIFHLAAQSFVPTSWHAPEETITTNVLGTLHVLEAVRELCPECVIHIAGSSEEYGAVQEVPIQETAPLRPLSPYAVSKVAQDMLGYQYRKSYGLNVLRTRAFNHSGPRRSPMFVLSGFVKSFVDAYAYVAREKSAAMNERAIITMIKHGNLNAVRDFVHVLDVVHAYYDLARKPYLSDDVVNICSGKGYHIYEALAVIESYAHNFLQMKKYVDYDYVEDPARMRPSDVPILVGSNTLMNYILKWKPSRDLETIISDLFNYWLSKMKG